MSGNSNFDFVLKAEIAKYFDSV